MWVGLSVVLVAGGSLGRLQWPSTQTGKFHSVVARAFCQIESMRCGWACCSPLAGLRDPASRHLRTV